jgi:hypothetical protein
VKAAYTHLDQILQVEPRTPNGCEECLKIGSAWVTYASAWNVATSAIAIHRPTL